MDKSFCWQLAGLSEAQNLATVRDFNHTALGKTAELDSDTLVHSFIRISSEYIWESLKFMSLPF